MAETVTSTAPCFLDLQWHGYWGAKLTGIACGEPSSATISFACVHEHVDTGRICDGCAVDMQQAAGAGTLTCPRCWDAPKSAHTCYCLVVIDWDSGEKTIVQEVPGAR